MLRTLLLSIVDGWILVATWGGYQVLSSFLISWLLIAAMTHITFFRSFLLSLFLYVGASVLYVVCLFIPITFFVIQTYSLSDGALPIAVSSCVVAMVYVCLQVVLLFFLRCIKWKQVTSYSIILCLFLGNLIGALFSIKILQEFLD